MSNIFLFTSFVIPIRNHTFAPRFLEIYKAIGNKDMYLTKETKQDFFKEYGKSEFDTGSPEGQVALFSHRIKHLTEHLKGNRKDKATERSLVRLVGKRRRILDYLKEKDITRYRAIIKKLGLRK
jgi:small subunit ribosomal protein S15